MLLLLIHLRYLHHLTFQLHLLCALRTHHIILNMVLVVEWCWYRLLIGRMINSSLLMASTAFRVYVRLYSYQWRNGFITKICWTSTCNARSWTKYYSNLVHCKVNSLYNETENVDLNCEARKEPCTTNEETQRRQQPWRKKVKMFKRRCH